MISADWSTIHTQQHQELIIIDCMKELATDRLFTSATTNWAAERWCRPTVPTSICCPSPHLHYWQLCPDCQGSLSPRPRNPCLRSSILEWLDLHGTSKTTTAIEEHIQTASKQICVGTNKLYSRNCHRVAMTMSRRLWKTEKSSVMRKTESVSMIHHGQSVIVSSTAVDQTQRNFFFCILPVLIHGTARSLSVAERKWHRLSIAEIWWSCLMEVCHVCTHCNSVQ